MEQLKKKKLTDEKYYAHACVQVIMRGTYDMQIAKFEPGLLCA